MNADSSEYGNLNAEYIDCRERIRIRDYHKFLSELSPSQISKVASSHMLFTYLKFYFILISFCYVLQDICYIFYKLNGLCNYIFYLCLEKLIYESKPSLSLCLCPIWEYQRLFWIRITLALVVSCPLLMLGADLLLNQSQATCLKSGCNIRKTTKFSLPIERLCSYVTLNG